MVAVISRLAHTLQGILLQIFSKPLSDRPTVFIEIIQRIGCEREASLQLQLLFVS
jgi:hypothetical protein